MRDTTRQNYRGICQSRQLAHVRSSAGGFRESNFARPIRTSQESRGQSFIFHRCLAQTGFWLPGQRLLIAVRCLRLTRHAIFSKKLGFRRVRRLRASGNRMVVDCRQSLQDELPLLPVKLLKEGLQFLNIGVSQKSLTFRHGNEETVQVNAKSHR